MEVTLNGQLGLPALPNVLVTLVIKPEEDFALVQFLSMEEKIAQVLDLTRILNLAMEPSLDKLQIPQQIASTSKVKPITLKRKIYTGIKRADLSTHFCINVVM